MVGRLRRRGYPTPAWRVSGVTEQGLSYVVQELVDAEAGSWSSIPLTEVLAAIELQAGLGQPASETWSTYIEWVLSSDSGPLGYLPTMGRQGLGIVDHFQRVLDPFKDCRLPDGDLVHGDLNTGNLLVRDGRSPRSWISSPLGRERALWTTHGCCVRRTRCWLPQRTKI